MPLKFEIVCDPDNTGSGVYYVKFRHNGRGKRVSLGTTSEAEARKNVPGVLAKLDSPIDTAKADAPKTVADCWAIYFEKKLSRGFSAVSGGYAWNLLKQHFAKLRPGLGEVTQEKIDEYVHLRASGKIVSQRSRKRAKLNTVRKELVYLATCLNFVSLKKYNQKLISPDAIDNFELPPEGDPRSRVLRDQEIDALIAAARRLRKGDRLSRVERFIWIAAETGSREGAIYDLTWDRVDFDNATIDFRLPGRKVTKKKRPSAVPISDDLMPVLRQAHAERISDLVMDNKQLIWWMLQEVVIEAGLAPAKEKGRRRTSSGISAHTFRHTRITQMCMDGHDIFDIANIIGDSVKTLLKHYAKFFVGQKQRDAVNTRSRRLRVVTNQERTKA